MDTFQGTFYRFSGEESDGQICVNVMREEDEINRFDFESFRYVVSEVATPIFGGATAAGEFASMIIVSRYLPLNRCICINFVHMHDKEYICSIFRCW